jgi:hypothetical protein
MMMRTVHMEMLSRTIDRLVPSRETLIELDRLKFRAQCPMISRRLVLLGFSSFTIVDVRDTREYRKVKED